MAKRNMSTWQSQATRYIGIVWIALAIVVLGFRPMETWTWRSINIFFLFLVAPMVYKSKYKASDRLSIIDVLIMLAGAAFCIHIITNLDRVVSRMYSFPTTMDVIVAVGAVLSLLILVRRIYGNALMVVGSFFIFYALTGSYLIGFFAHRGYKFARVMGYVASNEGIIGSPFGTATSFVLLFIMFGNFLNEFGAGEFLMDLSLALMGWTRGGGAKVACISSALMGTISGSIVGNVVTTGSMTIPLMKRTGYKSHFSAAVEAISSCGGALMPPVMGSSAFVMSELTGIEYSKIAIAAVIPALLFYLSVFLMIDLEAYRLNLKAMPSEEMPVMKKVMREKGWVLIPIGVLIYVLGFLRYSPTRAALSSIATLLALAALEGVVKKQMSSQGLKTFIIKIFNVFERTSKNVLGIMVACGTAGLAVGVLSLTGMALKLSTAVLNLSGGNLFIACVFTMLIAITLGMGLPTSAAYIICAAVAAPALIKLGVSVLQAHLFVFYYAILSNVTPPVALGAYAAAGISGDNPIKVALTALKLATACFVMPFLFAYQPVLLMQGSTMEILQAVISASVGVALLAIAIQGVTYWRTNMNIFERALVIAAAFAMLYPGTNSDFYGVIGGALLLGLNYFLKRKRVPTVPSA